MEDSGLQSSANHRISSMKILWCSICRQQNIRKRACGLLIAGGTQHTLCPKHRKAVLLGKIDVTGRTRKKAR